MTDSINVCFAGRGRVEVIREPVRPVADGHLLIAATCSLISTGTELTALHGTYDPGTHWDRWVSYPFRPGYSLVGRVVEAGKGCEDVAAGTRVVARVPHQQYVSLPRDDVVLVPDSISDEDAAWYAMATISQNGVRRASPQLGDCVVVVGLGLLGQLVVQYSRLLGAREVVAVDTAPMRLEIATKHGATVALESAVADVGDVVLELTNGAGADVVYDVTGAAPVLQSALGLVRRLGKLLLLGDSGRPDQQHLTGDIVTRGISLIGAHDSNPPAIPSDHTPWSKPEMGRLFFRYLERGEMRVSDLVTHRFDAEDAADAYALLTTARDTAMGVILRWPQP
jgi:2-desacetyl-2-hydroxyethyl bacteriochlorophyllide A dehydrogenase